MGPEAAVRSHRPPPPGARVCRATYEELRTRGVEFVAPPEEKPYGIEAIGKDNSGNWFSMTEHRQSG